MNKISIIALGWLGNALYDSLERQGKKVVGSFYSQPKGKKNEFFYDFKQTKLPNELLNSDVLIFNLTPSTIESPTLFKNFLDQTKQRIILSVPLLFMDKQEFLLKKRHRYLKLKTENFYTHVKKNF